MDKKSAFIAIVGRPNVGKSTLLNSIVGEKISIVSNKPQTTRNKITGILTKDNYQLIFVDTPGMHRGKSLLNKQIDKKAVSSLKEVDIILFVVDRKLNDETKHIINYFKNIKKLVFLVINKIDNLSSKSEIDEIIVSYMSEFDFNYYFPISATNNTNLDKLIEALKKETKEGPFYYPEDMISDQSDHDMIKELIREKILHYTEEEVPHAVGVIVEKITYHKEFDQYDINALIYVERSSQKAILLGKGGLMMKKIATKARKDINKVLKTKVHLEIWIKVKKDWRNKPSNLKELGYNE